MNTWGDAMEAAAKIVEEWYERRLYTEPDHFQSPVVMSARKIAAAIRACPFPPVSSPARSSSPPSPAA